MKKILLVFALVLCSFAHAEYTAENKIIKVVIPQPPASGLGALYPHIEAYAKKQNINMVPVFKPGADGKIGINYASKEKGDGNTLLFSTVNDYVNVNLDFDAIAPITKINMVVVASKKSKIKTINDIVQQERETPGKLTWAYLTSAQATYLDNFLKVTEIDPGKIYKVPFNLGSAIQGLVNGEFDLTAVPPYIATSFKDRITVIETDESIKTKLSLKDNATGVFLPKNSNKDSIKFWNKFFNDMLNDDEFKLTLKTANIEIVTNTTTRGLETIINNWKL